MTLIDLLPGMRPRPVGRLSDLDPAQRIAIARARLRRQEDVRAQLAALCALRYLR